MRWRLVETAIDSAAGYRRNGYRPLGDLGDIAKLGLTLSEAKQILARLQQVVVAVQADSHHTRIGGARAKTDGVLEGSARRKRP